MLTGYDNRTPAGLGYMQLVSGLLINSNGGAPGSSPLGWRMQLRVIPEPGPSLGLAAGALALVYAGRIAARRR